MLCFFFNICIFFEIQMDVNLPLRPVSTLVRSPNILTGLKGKLTSICISKNIYILKKNITFKIIYFNFIGANKPHIITTTRKTKKCCRPQFTFLSPLTDCHCCLSRPLLCWWRCQRAQCTLGGILRIYFYTQRCRVHLWISDILKMIFAEYYLTR